MPSSTLKTDSSLTQKTIFTVKMDTELEEVKKMPHTAKLTLEELIAEKKRVIEGSYGRKNMCVVTKASIFGYRSEVQMLESIIESLNRIHARLDALESR
jgi:hypothetical protein